MLDEVKKSLSVALSEEPTRLRVFSYTREGTESKRGTRLLPRAAAQLGSQPSSLLRLALPAPASLPGQAGQPKRTRHALVWGTLQGGVGFVSPLEEAAFRRLSFLGVKMVTGVQHAAGLNPRSFRAHRAGAGSSGELKNALDAALLRRYADLPCDEQEKLALQIGTTPQKLLRSLLELDVAAVAM